MKVFGFASKAIARYFIQKLGKSAGRFFGLDDIKQNPPVEEMIPRELNMRDFKSALLACDRWGAKKSQAENDHDAAVVSGHANMMMIIGQENTLA